MMLGLDEEYEYMETEFSYKGGDILYIYTDGIMAVRNSKNEIENIDDNTIKKIIEKSKNMSLKKSIEYLLEEISKVHNNGVYEDDITIIGIKF